MLFGNLSAMFNVLDIPVIDLTAHPHASAWGPSLEGGPSAPSAGGGARVYIETYGCAMNTSDSEILLSILKPHGYTVTDRPDDADVILINTCAIRDNAERRIHDRLKHMKFFKRKNRRLIIGVLGCMAERLRSSLLDTQLVDIVVGPDEYRNVPDLLAAAAEGERGIAVKLSRFETYADIVPLRTEGISAWVSIMRGCDKFCTFCVVPFTRGRERGASPREILRQVRELADVGYREVMLLGQTVNSYRWDDVTFAQLLRAVARVDGIERVRFTSPYPVDFTDEVIAAIAEEPKLCKYVHLPVQSGSDVVLERMRRGYTVDGYRAIVASLRRAMPQIALSTDILSGFSGETDHDHAQTLALMRELRFDSAFMFAYSERDLTFAAKKLPDDVTPEIKQRRLSEIVALQETISAEVFAAHVGRHERVLVHGPSKRDPTQLMGRTDGFKTVILPSGIGAVGELVDVTITRATMATLFG